MDKQKMPDKTYTRLRLKVDPDKVRDTYKEELEKESTEEELMMVDGVGRVDITNDGRGK